MKLNLWIALLLFSGSFLNAMEQQEETIPFQTMDGKTFLVKKEVAKNFRAIRSLFEDDKDIFQSLKNQSSESIPLNELVSAKIFQSILNFYDAEDKNFYLDELSEENLIDFIQGAFYLDDEVAQKMVLMKITLDDDLYRMERRLRDITNRGIGDIVKINSDAMKKVIFKTKNSQLRGGGITFKEHLLKLVPIHYLGDSQDSENKIAQRAFNISAQGSFVAACLDKTFQIRLYNVHANTSILFNCYRSDLVFSDDELLCCYQAKEDCLVVRETATGKICNTFRGPYFKSHFSHDGKFLAAVKKIANFDCEIVLLNLKKNREEYIFKSIGHNDLHRNYLFHKNGLFVYYKSFRTLGLLNLNDVDQSESIVSISHESNGHLTLFEISPDGKKLVFFGRYPGFSLPGTQGYCKKGKNGIYLYDIATKTLAFHEEASSHRLIFSPDSQFALTFIKGNLHKITLDSLSVTSRGLDKSIKESDFISLAHNSKKDGLLSLLVCSYESLICFSNLEGTNKKKITIERNGYWNKPSIISQNGIFFLEQRHYNLIECYGPCIDLLKLKKDIKKLSLVQLFFLKKFFLSSEPVPLYSYKTLRGMKVAEPIYEQLPLTLKQKFSNQARFNEPFAVARGSSSSILSDTFLESKKRIDRYFQNGEK